ncbi:neuroendocrine convertase 1-like [Hoplias malabaricus]|uniref:neuroendocrine convertase 1-like n=1 Tax=Hoplias malabaricus TaxID=27720 RepID=UPI0034627A18
MTAKIPDPKEPGWIINGAGFHVHDRYGFGLMDAAVMVQKAVNFQSIPDQRMCVQTVTLWPARTLPSGGEVSVAVQSGACRGNHNAINTLEHVQVTLDVSSVCRGDLRVELVSPVQTLSVLLDTRKNDNSMAGLKKWTLMTVQNWGEDPQGTWKVNVKDHKGTAAGCRRNNSEEAAGAIISITLTLYGTYSNTTTNHDAPLSGFISLGKFHTLPPERVSVRNRFPPHDLIHYAFKLEQENQIRAEDIPLKQHREKPETQDLSSADFSLKDLDNTDGKSIESHLHKLWNTLRNSVKMDQNNTLTQVNFQQVGVRVPRQVSAHVQKIKRSSATRKDMG